MLDSSQLPHILKLVDDESEPVQRAVAKALAEFGTSLDAELARLSPPPNGRLIQRVHQLVKNHERLQNNVQCRADLEPQFHSGQLVQHQRYGYRGVVVDLDLPDASQTLVWQHSMTAEPSWCSCALDHSQPIQKCGFPK